MTPSGGCVVMTCRAETDLAARIFAAAVDHVRAYLPDLRLVLVDDCSPCPLMQQYLDAWAARSSITVVRMGPPVAQGFYARVGIAAGQQCSFGHAPSLDRGLWVAARHLGRHWALALDGDVLVLAPSMAQQVEDAVAMLTEQVVAVGEWVGTPTDWQVLHLADGVHHFAAGVLTQKAAEPVSAAIRAYGYVNLMCSVVNLGTFWDPLVPPLQNSGWVANQWFYGQMALGRTVGYMPFFRSGAAVHIGAVAVATTQGETFGNVQGGRHYGQRDEGHYYAGYLQVADLTVLTAALVYRTTGLVALDHFVPPPPIIPTGPAHYLRYRAPVVGNLYVNHPALQFELVDRPTDTVLAQTTVALDGAVARYVRLDGADLAVQRELYEEVFEHIPALQRTRVWTPEELATRLGAEREVHEQVDGHRVFHWRYFSRGVPQWRWAEHYGWGHRLTEPLEAPIR